MSFIGGNLRSSLQVGKSGMRPRRAAIDVGFMYNFDPRKAKNHKLQEPQLFQLHRNLWHRVG